MRDRRIPSTLAVALAVAVGHAQSPTGPTPKDSLFDGVGSSVRRADTVYLVEPASGPDPLKWIKDLGIVVAVASGVAGLAYNGYGFVGSITQRRKETRWKQANLARELVDRVHAGPGSNQALMMIDWEGKTYHKPDGTDSGQIHHAQLVDALTRTSSFHIHDDGIFIRDAFDVLFERLGELQRHIESELILAEDVDEVFQYYFEKLSLPESEVLMAALRMFMVDFHYPSALRFFDRFDSAGKA